MRQVNEWFTREIVDVVEDPSFLITSVNTLDEAYPWEEFRLNDAADSAWVQVPLGGRDGERVYQVYAHLHLMAAKGELEEWLPEAPEAEGYELELAILRRCADAWVLGRTVFDTVPFDPLDEIAYVSEAGYLEPFIFTSRPNEFAEERTEWVRENPEGMEEFREWFIDTFNREPPGLRSE